MDAYDYERQEWVSGKKGADVAINQIHEELLLVEGPDGAGHLRYVGSKQTVDQVRSSLYKNLRAALAEVHS